MQAQESLQVETLAKIIKPNFNLKKQQQVLRFQKIWRNSWNLNWWQKALESLMKYIYLYTEFLGNRFSLEIWKLYYTT